MKKEIFEITNTDLLPSIFNIKKYDNPFFKTLALKINDDWIGYLSYFLIYDRIEVEYIFILNKERNKGYAKMLFQELFAIAYLNKCINITLEVDVTNTNAILLYKDIGFKTVSIRKNYYGKKDGYLMMKEFEVLS